MGKDKPDDWIVDSKGKVVGVDFIEPTEAIIIEGLDKPSQQRLIKSEGSQRIRHRQADVAVSNFGGAMPLHFVRSLYDLADEAPDFERCIASAVHCCGAGARDTTRYVAGKCEVAL